MKKLLGAKPLRRMGLLAVLLLATGMAVKAVAAPKSTGPASAVFAPDVGDAQQVVLVRTGNWSDTAATVEAFELKGGEWRRAIGPVAATIGRGGFSLNHREGDGSSPTGVFKLSFAYGLQPRPSGVTFPYEKFSRDQWWVSDPESPLYNTLQSGPPAGRWRESFGERLSDDQYKTAYRELIKVDYNVEPVVPGAGSAIFMHVGGTKPTSGCVALDEAALLQIMRWLNPDMAPRIVMGPEPWLLNPLPAPPVSAAASPAVGLATTQPRRLLDTRVGLGAPQRKLGPRESIDVSIDGPNVPADVSVVALNVTITNPTLATFLKVTPTGVESDVSNLNAHAGDERAALVMARVGPDRKVRITNDAGTTDVVADVVAYGAPSVADGFVPSAPNRIIDTRNEQSANKDQSPMFGPTEERTYATSAPPGTVAAVVNLTITNATERTWVSAFAGDSLWPGTSSVNVSEREPTANLAIVPLSANKSMTFKNGLGRVNVVVDVLGWIRKNEGNRYVPASTPTRILDTRSGIGRRGQLGPESTYILGVQGLPTGAKALVATLTGVNATTETNLRVDRADLGDTPATSSLNLPKDEPRANLVVSPLSTDGQVLIYNSAGATDVLVDVSGWFV
jgi:L,D-peptidoglycan transpeptidase YkuD (ErfK/YbiS/YcfS/YnhG family)